MLKKYIVVVRNKKTRIVSEKYVLARDHEHAKFVVLANLPIILQNTFEIIYVHPYLDY